VHCLASHYFHSRLVQLVIPFVLMLFGNSLLIYKFLKFKKLFNSRGLPDPRQYKDNYFLFLIISLNTVVLITQLPITILQTISNINRYDPNKILLRLNNKKFDYLTLAIVFAEYFASIISSNFST
jgi:hypothetical protein